MLSGWRVGYPYSIGETETEVVQGLTAAGSPVKLYFDPQSGLLVRQVRYASTAAGALPTQVDYSDYREVGGVKMPFRVMTTWADGRTLTRAHRNSAERADRRREIRPARARSPLEIYRALAQARLWQRQGDFGPDSDNSCRLNRSMQHPSDHPIWQYVEGTILWGGSSLLPKQVAFS